jgi:translocation protein SEC63
MKQWSLSPTDLWRSRKHINRLSSILLLPPSHADFDLSLTDENIRKNWELYGHPDGRQEMSIGIGLPRWIVKGRNNIWVLSFYTLAFGGALPLLMVGQSLFSIRLVTGGCVFHSGPRSRQKTKDGVNGRIATIIFKTLQEDSSTNQVLGTLERSLRWEQPTSSSRPSSDLCEMESQIREQLGQ